MARKKPMDGEFIAFNVVYEDGSLSSNRKVPTAILDGLADTANAKASIEAQDRDIAGKSGRPRGRIKSIERVKRK
ncbi:hypothetical protein [Parvibaculum sp.]|jgi:hypothetical protein|uniref:hypothetical protein n=1 Tax=Parvibaculum sp. TaxID=2024848 RepID=UPI000C3A5A8E|nr:hypothetical protein [Parvibaculum sp.]HAC58563.1 hypothetical protein [Rhodobiaceae bacterium]MAU60714.1 hypothetical protein [Parvibaculum sp.]MBO6667590.1 hypothetical protein [Parvibaculum sp.]MBO6692152.1 hypothetical protein [Parvibaculum sp.]MBO6714141.1 hypothetical protein [Parvibaculum sp.]|tara:strand:+ start:2560 stop:2784 length:225 start_codon:yes stop_codon:yes gene_type:complete